MKKVALKKNVVFAKTGNVGIVNSLGLLVDISLMQEKNFSCALDTISVR